MDAINRIAAVARTLHPGDDEPSEVECAQHVGRQGLWNSSKCISTKGFFE
jgi:hypothetical protein